MWLGFFLQHIGFVENCEGSLIPLVPEGLKRRNIFSAFTRKFRTYRQ